MKTKLILFSVLTTLFLFTLPETGVAQTQTVDYINVKSGNGKGVRFWGGSNAFKIDAGNSNLYKYGPVTNFSIKMNMTNWASRGWTWGVHNKAPIAALNTQGHFQTAGWIKSMNRNYYFGNTQRLRGNNSAALFWHSAHSTVTTIKLVDKEGTLYGQLYGSGNGKYFGLLDGDANWSYLAVKDEVTTFRINNHEKMRIMASGNIGIGTTSPNYKLDVLGTIRAKEVRVQTGWSDHVFLPEYKLPTLQEEEAFINQNGHLLGFESEKAMGGEVQLADVTNRQQEAIEKLMLHVIELEKEIKALKAERQ